MKILFDRVLGKVNKVYSLLKWKFKFDAICCVEHAWSLLGLYSAVFIIIREDLCQIGPSCYLEKNCLVFFMSKWKLANFAAIVQSSRTVITTFLLNKKFEVTIESLLSLELELFWKRSTKNLFSKFLIILGNALRLILKYSRQALLLKD